jgi:hypothetical protein
MADTQEGLLPSTPESVKATAQTNEASSPHSGGVARIRPSSGEGTVFIIGEGMERAVEGRPYERKSGRPLYRPLKIFALDPSFSRLEGATAIVNVPYEPLACGPWGKLFKVVAGDCEQGGANSPVNLDDPMILIRSGLDPSSSNKHFHEQMVYAVCSIVYTAFRTALGRHIAWGFDKPQDGRTQLLIRPHALKDKASSHYDKKSGELCFGYFRKQKVKGPNLPGGTVYLCLSHDVVAHEVTHALLDGLRTHFSSPTGIDVLAFHEGFADLVAVFQHFSYDQVVRAAIRKSCGTLSQASLLTDIARQFGQTGRGTETALRSAIDVTDEQTEPKMYRPEAERHELGSVLVAAVFEAFMTVYRRKTERLFRIATNGSGQLPSGEMPQDLQAALAEIASKLASQFLTICIRAIDYCPPVDITFGEYLRAVITADKDLVPNDPWGYREAWIDAFRRRNIYPEWVTDLSEEALLWSSPETDTPYTHIEPIAKLTFARLRFNGDPAWPASKKELKRQARALGELVTKPEIIEAFGLGVNGDKRLNGDEVELPRVQSIRTSRRIGPNGQVVFDLVAEVTQLRVARIKGSEETCAFYGGATIILDPYGKIRYVIKKSVINNDRLEMQREFLSTSGAQYKELLYGKQPPEANLFMMLHEPSSTEAWESILI